MFNVSIPARSRLKLTSLLLATAVHFSSLAALAQSAPAPEQLPTGGEVVGGQAVISQSGANMNIDQATQRAAINWDSFDIGAQAHVNFNQPNSNSVALNRVLNGNPTQIFGRLSANGQIFLTNAAGVYFAPGASVNVGSLVASTHRLSDEDFMAGRNYFSRDGATGEIVNEGTLNADIGGYIALLAPEVRNEGVIIAQMGTVALAAGETFELELSGQNGLANITVTKADIETLVENKQAVQAPGGLIILSAQAAHELQGGVVKNSGTIEATGLVNDGGVVRLMASGKLELGGTVNVDAAFGSDGNGGEVWAVASLDNPDSSMTFSGEISARGGDTGGDGGFVETSGSHVTLDANAQVNTMAPEGETGDWLIDPYDYDIDAAAATAIETSLSSSNVEVTTSADNASHGSDGNAAGTGNITVSSAIDSSSANELTLTAANAIDVDAEISTGALTLNGPGGITLGADLSTLTDMILNGDVTLDADVTLTSGVSDTYTTYTTYVVPGAVTELTATLVGGSGGKGGNDGGHQGGAAGSVGTLTASFDVTGGQNIYIAPGSGGAVGVSSSGSAAGGAGGTNQFNLGDGGDGGVAGSSGSSGGGGGGGAATVVVLTNSPNSGTAMLMAAGGGGGGGSGNNTACPGLCAGQDSTNYRSDNQMDGETGPNAIIGAQAITDGGASGGGGGGVVGGAGNASVFFPDEWTGRGGNVGQSGAANGFSTNSLSTSLAQTGNSQDGYAIISYGGGTIDINGTINGSQNLDIIARSTDVDISGAIGGNTALTSLEIVGAQGIALAGGGVTSTGVQSYTGPLTLDAAATSFTTTSNGAVTFAGDILKGAGVASDLSVSTGSGAVSFNGETGSSVTPIGALAVSTTGTTTFSGATYAQSLSKTGSGTTVISGGTIQTVADQAYAAVLDLGDNTTLRSTGAGNITLNGAVSNSTQKNLTINAADGDVTLFGNLAIGTNDRPTPIGDVSITASGTVTLGSSGTPLSVDAKSLSVTADDADIYAGTSNFTCGTGASAPGICLTDSASFNVTEDSTFTGPLTGTATLTKDGTGKLTMTGNNTYSGNTTVDAGILEIGAAGKLGNGNYAGDISVTGQLRVASSENMDFTGAISGTGFINSPAGGTLDITTLSQDYYNLATAYIVPTSSGSGNSSLYGDVPTFSYQIATTVGGGTLITDADPSGTATINGAPTSTSNVGNYTASYGGGLTLGNERYNSVQAGNDLSWAVLARPLTVAVSKVYNGSALFSDGFTLSGMVNGDAMPTVSGNASVSSKNAGDYTSFSNSSLTQNDTNYTLTGATIGAEIIQKALDVAVSKAYDGSNLFSKAFTLSGVIDGDATPSISGSASAPNTIAGNYTSFASNNLVLSDANYTLNGGAVSATITQKPPTLPTTTPVPQNTTPQQNNPPPLTLPGDTSTTGGLQGNNQLINTTQSFTNGAAPSSTTVQGTSAAPLSSSPTAEGGNTGTNTGGTGTTLETSASSTSSQNGGGNNDIVSSAPIPSAQGDSGSSPISVTRENGIIISLMQEPSAQSSGLINVAVPKETMARANGFSFPVPEQVHTGAGTAPNIRLSSGDPLPSWLRFNAQTKTFVATFVPAGGLPVHVVVAADGAESTIVISEMP